MNLRVDDRGQSLQVGAVLLFAMVIIAMSVYQASVVPGQNAEIEFDSYLDASSDVADLRNDILGAAATNQRRGTTLTTGTTYPSRVFFVNPGPATGRVSTGDPEPIRLSNVEGTSDARNVDRYIQSEASTLDYTTRDVVFDPSYNEIDEAPVVLSHGFVYRNYSSAVPLSTQTLVQGNRITLVTVAGDLDAGGLETTVTTEPVSAHTRTVSVTNRTDDPLVLTVPTSLSVETWEDDVLPGQLDPSGTNPDRYVTSVTAGPTANTVNVTLEAGETYELRVGRVELHAANTARAVEDPEARYLVATMDRNVTTTKGRVKLTVEARDRYNNPVSNAVVNFTGEGDDFETQDGRDLSMPVRTAEDGRATVWYNATGVVGNLPVKAYLGTSEPAEAEKKVRFRVTNTYTGTGGGGSGADSDINPGSYVVLQDASKTGNDVVVTLNHTGQVDANITAVRFSFYFEDQQNAVVASAVVSNASTNTQLATLEKFGAFESISPPEVVAGGGSYRLKFRFYEDDGTVFQPQANKDFFVFEVVYDDAYTATYFVSFE